MDKCIQSFLIEGRSLLDQLNRDFVQFERYPESKELVAGIFRAIHRIQEAAGTAQENLEEVANPDAPHTAAPSGPILLGEILVKQGAVAKAAVAEALEIQQAGDPRPLGEILVENGVAVRKVVRDALQAQCESREEAANSSIRVDVGLLDEVLDRVGELVLARNQLLQFTSKQNDPAFISTAQRLNLITSALQKVVMKTRMQPIANVSNEFPRIVRDLSHSTGKIVRLEMEGTQTKLDLTIIEAIKDPLTCLVCNAIDHGIETPAEREAAGKKRQGVLFMRAFHERGQVTIEISDDGAGLNLDAIKATAIERGMLSPQQAAEMSDREIGNLIFAAGFSAAKAIMTTSARGVDVLRTNIEKIGGTIEVFSVRNRGTTLKIKIPSARRSSPPSLFRLWANGSPSLK